MNLPHSSTPELELLQINTGSDVMQAFLRLAGVEQQAASYARQARDLQDGYMTLGEEASGTSRAEIAEQALQYQIQAQTTTREASLEETRLTSLLLPLFGRRMHVQSLTDQPIIEAGRWDSEAKGYVQVKCLTEAEGTLDTISTYSSRLMLNPAKRRNWFGSKIFSVPIVDKTTLTPLVSITFLK